MKNFRSLLDIKLLSQPFNAAEKPELHLQEAKVLAQIHAKLDHCISVLSDMKSRKSYVYYGALAKQLGLQQTETEINSIWEDNLFDRVHPEDLQKKFRLELLYFQRLTSVNITDRSNFEALTRLRVRDIAGKYMVIQHRLIYISSLPDGSAWLALCLYSRIPDHPGFNVPEGLIIDKLAGTVIISESDTFTKILSYREKQVLQLIKHGHKSKEIASTLSLSLNTVNRHRQNIFQKLNAGNAMEACRIAESTGLIS
jgi:DNA-binding CsgD family transcriptional regulator